jgi:hypothetical protein
MRVRGFHSAATVPGSAALPFVISTGGIMGQRAHQGDEKGSCSATTVPGSTALPFVISTGAQRSGEISVWMLFLGNVFLAECVYPHGARLRI